MSLYVDVAVNYDRLCGLVITRVEGDEEPDSYNTYVWRLHKRTKIVASGEVVHRYGDGALALVAHAASLASEYEKSERKTA